MRFLLNKWHLLIQPVSRLKTLFNTTTLPPPQKDQNLKVRLQDLGMIHPPRKCNHEAWKTQINNGILWLLPLFYIYIFFLNTLQLICIHFWKYQTTELNQNSLNMKTGSQNSPIRVRMNRKRTWRCMSVKAWPCLNLTIFYYKWMKTLF